ncbi:MAG: Rha family transcriptional regulator [Labrys sp. (in: a-proteobacteria)]
MNEPAKKFELSEGARRPIVTNRDGEVFANSRDVADYFGKNHRDVLRDIDNLIRNEPSLPLRNFAQGVYTLETTGSQQHRYFDMTRDGFTLLAMGFTGAKALKFKLAYIEAFNAMEAELRKPRLVVDFSDPRTILGVMSHLQEQVADRDAKLAIQGERLEKMDRLEASIGAMAITDAAKTLKVSPQHLFRFMSSRSWIYKRAGNQSWIARQEKIESGYMEHREHVYIDSQGNERVATRALVTGKGLLRLSELLNEKPH